MLSGNDSKPPACVECEHHSFERIDTRDSWRYLHYCERPALRNLVTGQHSLAEGNRLNEKKCGWAGKYFTVKQELAKP